MYDSTLFSLINYIDGFSFFEKVIVAKNFIFLSNKNYLDVYLSGINNNDSIFYITKFNDNSLNYSCNSFKNYYVYNIILN